MSSGSSGGGRRRGRRFGGHVSEINVTPFVDVMLVLLVIFMVTAPMLTAGVQVDLPQSAAGAVQDKDNKPIEISVRKNGDIFIGETQVGAEKMITILSNITNNDFDRRIFLRADKTLDYGTVMRLIGDVNKAGYGKVALISDSKR
ncbi:MAG: protein TolR [Pseudomonadota bacterium]